MTELVKYTCMNLKNLKRANFTGTHCTNLNITNAITFVEEETPVYGTLQVKCRSRHVLFGERNITCQSGGKWSSEPTCKKYGKGCCYFWKAVRRLLR